MGHVEDQSPGADPRPRAVSTDRRFTLLIGDDALAVCRLGRDEPLPDWAARSGFVSITRTPDELSVVCPATVIPEGVRADRGWRALRVAGTLDFSVVGVLASLAVPLAEAGVSLFAVSTFDTDYLLVKDLDRAIQALRGQGHDLRSSDQDDRS